LIRGAIFALILLLAPSRVKQNGWGAFGGNDAKRSRNLIWRPMTQSEKPGPPHVPEPLDDRWLPIDEAVRDYIVSPNQGRSLLREGFPGSAFQEMRGWLSIAAWQRMSARDVEERIRVGNRELEAWERDAQEREALLRSWADDPRFQHLTSRPQRGLDRPNFQEEARAIDLCSETPEALRRDADLLREGVELSRASRSQTPSFQTSDKAADAAFAAPIAFGWRSLTGTDPPPTSRKFAKIVAAAHLTLCKIHPSELLLCLELPNAYWDPEQEKRLLKKTRHGGRVRAGLSWNGQSTKTLERIAERPVWDRLDRYEKGLLPPGVDVHNTGFLESWKSSHVRYERDMRQMILDMSSESAAARFAAATMLLARFKQAGEARRAWFLEIGFRPDEATAILALPVPYK
jgi:hypothetical protein